MNLYEWIDDIRAQVQKRVGEKYLVTVENMKNGHGPGDYAFCIRNIEGEGKAVAYLPVEEVYSDHKRGISIEPAMDKFLEEIRCVNHYLEKVERSRIEYEWEIVKDWVYPILIWTERNQELLSMLPHRKFLDLSVGYIVRRTYSNLESIAVKITKDLLKMLDITEEELYQQALRNLKKDHYKLKNMEEIIRENFTEEAVEKFTDDGSLLVLSNGEKWYGAAGLLLGKKFFHHILGNRSYYVIPSSIHEVMFVPADTIWKEDDVNRMLRQVNQEELSEEEWLNNHVYIYNGRTGEIELV